ncbi:MAG: carbohydrate ABC transporter permease [Chloroflexaceae bacterium]|jgi:multiple sugar transport system permease protein|nr:carbohydrate ABC transporter permease [Chloroflexaceae bacterium]
MASIVVPGKKTGREAQAQRRKLLGKILTTAASVTIVAIFFFPILFWVLASFKPFTQIFQLPPSFIFEPTLAWYRVVLGGESYTTIELEQTGAITGTGGGSYYSVPFILDSLKIATISTAIVMVLATLAAYALSRFTMRRKQDLIFWILSTRMMPTVVVALPFFLMYRSFQWIDTLHGVVLMHVVMNLPLATLLLKSFFDDVPTDLDDAAMVDGATRFGAFYKVILNYVWPGIAAAAILCFIFSWNEFLLTLTVTQTNIRTMPVAASTFDSSSGGTEWGFLAALGTSAMLPVFIFVLFVQKHLVRGLTMGALHGK